MTDRDDDQKLVYCSGSHYSLEESTGLLEIAKVLDGGGFRTYLPSRDGIDFLIGKLAGVDPAEMIGIMAVLNKAVFAVEIFQVVRRCDALVFSMNGRTPEEGSVFKTSLAYAVGLPLVLYKNDNRSVFNGRDNTMITGLSADFSTISRLNRLPGALSTAIQKGEGSRSRPGQGGQIPPFLRQVAESGERVWDLLQKFDFRGLDDAGFHLQVLDFRDRCREVFDKLPVEI